MFSVRYLLEDMAKDILMGVENVKTIPKEPEANGKKCELTKYCHHDETLGDRKEISSLESSTVMPCNREEYKNCSIYKIFQAIQSI